MEWSAEALVISAKPHGETSVILDVLTEEHGRHAGVVRGGVSRKMAPILQPGGQVAVTWRARLEEHIGSFTVEPIRARPGLMQDRLALAGLGAVSALLRRLVPERMPLPVLYADTVDLLDQMDQGAAWQAGYLGWELMLLELLGYGLDLSACAVTGAEEGLVYISPKSGRAVSAEGAGAWADRLLPLSPLLIGGEGDARDVLTGLAATGYFLETHAIAETAGGAMPEARARLIARLERWAEGA